MKKTFALMACAALALSASTASATVYNDTAGDVFTGAGGGILDILSAEVTDDGTNINFKINLAGDPVATDWGKYMVMIDNGPTGDPSGNGWGRPISWGPVNGGANYWLGSWVDGPMGAENRVWDGAAWQLQDATYNAAPNNQISISKNSSSATISLPLARLNLGLNQQFCFDIFTSGGGGGDGAIDSLGNAGIQVGDWGQPSTAVPVCYTTTPEPGSIALLAVGAFALIRRRR